MSIFFEDGFFDVAGTLGTAHTATKRADDSAFVPTSTWTSELIISDANRGRAFSGSEAYEPRFSGVTVDQSDAVRVLSDVVIKTWPGNTLWAGLIVREGTSSATPGFTFAYSLVLQDTNKVTLRRMVTGNSPPTLHGATLTVLPAAMFWDVTVDPATKQITIYIQDAAGGPSGVSAGNYLAPDGTWTATRTAFYDATDPTPAWFVDSANPAHGYSYFDTQAGNAAGVHFDNFAGVPPGTALSPGTLSSTGQTATTISLSSTAPTGGSGSGYQYKLQRSAHGANSWSDVGAFQAGTTWTDTGLTAATTYDYRVQYEDDASGTATSDVLSVATTGPAPTSVTLSVPGTGTVGAGLTVTATLDHAAQSTIHVTVAASPDGSLSGSPITINSGSSSGTCTYTPASTGVKTLSCTNDAGLTDGADQTTTISEEALTADVIAFSESDPATGITLAVAAGGGGAGTITRRLYRSAVPGFTPPGAGSVVATETGTITTITDPGPAAATPYFYVLRTTDTAGGDVLSNEVGQALWGKPLIVGIIGDSNLAGGFGVTPIQNGVLASRLAQLRGSESVTLVNQAIAGTASAHWVPGQTAYDNAVIAFQGAGLTADNGLVIVMLGTNDWAASISETTYRGNLAQTVAGLRGEGWKVLLFAAPAVGANAGWDTQMGFLVEYGMTSLPALADGVNVFRAPQSLLWTLNNFSTAFGPDNVHFSAAGAAGMADLMAEQIQQAFNPSASGGGGGAGRVFGSSVIG